MNDSKEPSSQCNRNESLEVRSSANTDYVTKKQVKTNKHITHLLKINDRNLKKYHFVRRKEVLNLKAINKIPVSKIRRRVKVKKNINQSLADAMEKMRLVEYAEYLNHPWRLLWMNFLIGLARGLGATIGLAVVLIIAINIAQNIISANLPLISHWVLELIEFVNDYYRNW